MKHTDVFLIVVLLCAVDDAGSVLNCYRCQYDNGVASGTYVSFANGGYSVLNTQDCETDPFDHTAGIPTAACEFDHFYCEMYNWTFHGRMMIIRNCASFCQDSSTTRTVGNTVVNEQYTCCQLDLCNGNFSEIATPAPTVMTGAEGTKSRQMRNTVLIVVAATMMVTWTMILSRLD